MDRSNPPDFTSPDVNRSCAAMPDRSHCQSDANVSFASHPPPSNLMTDDSSNMVKPSSESDDANESCSYRSNGSSVGDSSPSDEPQELCTNGDPSSPKRSKNGKRKRDRSKLRKGKWTVSFLVKHVRHWYRFDKLTFLVVVVGRGRLYLSHHSLFQHRAFDLARRIYSSILPGG